MNGATTTSLIPGQSWNIIDASSRCCATTQPLSSIRKDGERKIVHFRCRWLCLDPAPGHGGAASRPASRVGGCIASANGPSAIYLTTLRDSYCLHGEEASRYDYRILPCISQARLPVFLASARIRIFLHGLVRVEHQIDMSSAIR
jgi:hypothetical protein